MSTREIVFDLVSGGRFASLSNGSTIRYCRTEELPLLLDTITSDTLPFTLITHNSDRVLRDSDICNFTEDPKYACIRRWFSSNTIAKGVVPLPLGLVNQHSPRGCLLDAREAGLENPDRKDKVLILWDDRTNRLRPKLKQLLRGLAEVDVVEQRLGYYEYMKLLRSYRYVLSPPGTGPDCHRNWEALAMGCIPIVPDFAGHEVAALRSFSELSFWRGEPTAASFLECLSELRDRYKGNICAADHSHLYMPYWESVIGGKQATHIISFSLWGADDKYNMGMIENAKLAKEHFPKWQVWVYWGNGVPSGVLQELERQGCVLLYMGSSKGASGMFWRFAAAGYEGLTAVLFRDADSRLSLREKLLVQEWLQSGKSAHSLHDHPHHVCKSHSLFGGMWGVLGSVLPNMAAQIEQYPSKQQYIDDMRFLTAQVWPKVKDSVLTHSSVPLAREYISIKGAADFIGKQHPAKLVLPTYKADNIPAMYSGEQAAIRRCAKQIPAGRFLNLGAADGILGDSFYELVKLGWEGVCLEPSPSGFAELRKNYDKYPRVELRQAAWVPETQGKTRLLLRPNPRLSTTIVRLGDKRPDDAELILVDALTYDDLPQDFVAVKIDIEGGNITALRALPGKWPIRLLVVEHAGENERKMLDWFEQNGYLIVHRNRENLVGVK